MRRSRVLSVLSSLLVGGFLVGLSACSSENAEAPPPAPVDWHAFEVPHAAMVAGAGPTPKERAIAEAYVGILASPDLAALTPHLAVGSRFAFPGMADGRGRESVLAEHRALFGSFDKRTVTMTRVLRSDSVQAVEWTLTGVQTKDWLGVAATNKPVAFKGLTLLFTNDDGTIADIHVYFDAAVVKAQLGVGPKELATLPPSAAPSGPPQVIEATHSEDEAHDVTAARASPDALEKKDEAAYLATMTDDVQVETLERAQPMRREDLRGYFRSMHKAIGLLDTTLDNSFGVSKYAVIEYFIAGEQQGALGWIPAQHDKVVRLQVVDVTEIRDGKVAHVWRYDNPGQIIGGGP